ncbi:hypothetical protein [Sediminibacillus massiliensis]|uniref:hypothetical protein n=1 Tax=Sediminibacillus massiliensis TaxID=1926277 RepID=UPI0009888D5C|nr:hypothetical protein [Sediminibacillus massiliensis]
MNLNNKAKLRLIVGWILLLLAVGFFCLQLGSFFVQARFQAEYVDDRLFYIINMICVICLAMGILLLLRPRKLWAFIGVGAAAAYLFAQVVLLVHNNQETDNITSISPDWKHVLSIKENMETGESVYYRSYYKNLARPKEPLPFEIDGEVKVDWLADDVAVVTYKAENETIQQYIGTYGDRGTGRSYYYVGAETHGRWQGENVEVINDAEGITVSENGEAETFDWDHIEQFGTLAIVLKRDNHAVWTISLDENFEVHSDASEPMEGTITLYKATMEDNQPITLEYVGEN